MKLDAPIVSTYTLLFVLVSLHVCSSVIGEVTGACGNDICTRRGFEACITTPLVDTVSDSYCLECTNKRSRCGKVDQMEGCHLFCQEELQSDKLDIQNELDKTKTVQIAVVCLLVLAILVILVLATKMSIGRLRHVLENRTQRDEEKGATDSQDSEEGNEMTTMLQSQEPIVNLSASVTSQLDKTEGNEMSNGMCTSNKCTDNGCPAMIKLNNIPPTDSCNGVSVNLAIPT